jgi:transposase
MARTRAPYTPEFRSEAVRLARSSGRPPAEIARDLGCCTETLKSRMRQTAIDAGKAEGLTSDEREELRRLRRQVRILREERDILKKSLKVLEVGAERTEDFTCQVAFQVAHDLWLRQPLLCAPFDVGTGAWAAAQPHNDGQMQGSIGCAVAAAVQPVSLGASAGGRDGRHATEVSERGLRA